MKILKNKYEKRKKKKRNWKTHRPEECLHKTTSHPSIPTRSLWLMRQRNYTWSNTKNTNLIISNFEEKLPIFCDYEIENKLKMNNFQYIHRFIKYLCIWNGKSFCNFRSVELSLNLRYVHICILLRQLIFSCHCYGSFTFVFRSFYPFFFAIKNRKK